jgi:hypothetical protein
MRSKVADIVADSETLANSEKVRRIKIEYPRDWLTSVMFLVMILPLACRQVNAKRISVRKMRTEPWLIRKTPPIIAKRAAAATKMLQVCKGSEVTVGFEQLKSMCSGNS